MRYGRIVVAVMLATTGVGALWINMSRRSRDLLSLSSPVANISAWYQPEQPEYYWLDDTCLLHFTGIDRDHLTPVRVDTRTGAASVLTGLARLMKTSPEICNVEVSASRVLWNDSSCEIHLSDLAGNWHRTATHSWPCSWLDSQHWLSWPGYDGDYRAEACAVHTLDDNSVSKLWVPAGVDPHYKFSVRTGNGWRLYRVDWHDDKETKEPYIELSEASLDNHFHSVSPPHVRSLPLNPGTHVVDVSISPIGDRLAWLSHNETRSPIWRTLAKLVGHGTTTEECALKLEVSSLDGTNRSTIGTLTVPAHPDPDAIALQWLPSGRRLSFAYRSDLYLTPILAGE